MARSNLGICLLLSGLLGTDDKPSIITVGNAGGQSINLIMSASPSPGNPLPGMTHACSAMPGEGFRVLYEIPCRPALCPVTDCEPRAGLACSARSSSPGH